MQPATLFNQKQMRSMKRKEKKPAKVYGLTDCFFFGIYERKPLGKVAMVNPLYLNHMKDRYKMQYTKELQQLINSQLFISK